jgi:hypothetical protein
MLWRYVLLLAAATLPGHAVAAQTFLPDPHPPASLDSRYTGGRVMKSGMISQFDSLGRAPMGDVGDSVTAYLFLVGDQLGRVVHAKITRRQRFLPPDSWRAACDEIAHPGWIYTLSAPTHADFGVVVPGTHPRPEKKPLPAAVHSGAWQFFHALADSSFERYRTTMKPQTERAVQYMQHDFYGAANDARWDAVQFFGVQGVQGHSYAALSFAFRDDYPGDIPTTSRVWMLDAWGYPVARAQGQIDIYGTVPDGVADAVVTSSGLMRWDGTQWIIPPIYSEEPCLFHQTMPVPAGARP